MPRRAPPSLRPRARLGVLAAAALIAVAGIALLVLGPWPHASPSSPAAALLRQGTPDTAPGYWQRPSAALAAAAAGAEDARFRALGALLVNDGFAAPSSTSAGRYADWYNWGEQKCPRAEPDCYILAWRHAVDAIRSVPGSTSGSCGPPSPAAPRPPTPGPVPPTWTWWAPTSTTGTAAPTTLTRTPPPASWTTTRSGGRSSPSPGASTGSHGCPSSPASPSPSPVGPGLPQLRRPGDPAFIARMLAWLHAHHAIGVYWAVQHVTPDRAVPPGPLLAGLGADAANPAGMNDLGLLLGGRLQYTEVFLPQDQPVSGLSAQPVLAPWQHAGCQLILDVPLVPLTVPSYSGPPEPGRHPYHLADYPDALAAFRQGIRTAQG